jgi:hypothetical protein
LLIGCGTLAIAGTLLALAGGALVLIFFLCRKCECGFPWKLLGQLVIIVGVVMSIYVLPGSCVPLGTPGTALWAVLVVLLMGIFGLLYGSWYLPFRAVCPLTICDFWGALQEAVTVAILSAAILVFPPLLAGGMSPVNLGFTLLLIAIGLPLIHQQLQSNQHAGNC